VLKFIQNIIEKINDDVIYARNPIKM